LTGSAGTTLSSLLIARHYLLRWSTNSASILPNSLCFNFNCNKLNFGQQTLFASRPLVS